MTPGSGNRCAATAEYQRRAVVHFHALIRLDAAGDGFLPSALPLNATDLADAVGEAAASVVLTVGLCGVAPATPQPPPDASDRHIAHADQAEQGDLDTPAGFSAAEGEGFEPSTGCPVAVFKTAAIGH